MQPGEVIDGRHRLIRVLGTGGFGTVWLAEESELGRRVAIKFLHAPLEERAALRFHRECEALARLSHDHIMTLLAVGEHRGLPFLVTEFIDGEPMSVWALSPRSLEEVVSVTSQIASALVGAHRAGIVHRDLKPSNVMIEWRNGALFVTVLDFGLAKLAGPTQLDVTKTGQVVGTPGFMSPEQLRADEVGPASDLYNLGVILWQLIEGRKLFEGESAIKTCMMHLREEPPPLTQAVPLHIEELVFRLLSKEPARRGRSIQVLRTLQGSSQPATPLTRSQPHRADAPSEPSAATRTPRRGGPVAIASMFLAAVVIIFLVMMSGADDAPPPAKRDLTRARSLVERTPEPEPEIGVDAGAAEVAPGPRGCGVAWEPGEVVVSSPPVLRHTLVRLPRDDDASIIVIPEGYDPHHPIPMVLVLHDGAQTPRFMLEQARQLVEGDEVRAITVFAEGERVFTPGSLLASIGGKERPIASYPWPQRHVDGLPSLVTIIEDAFCIDPSRRYLIGHGRGATGAERLMRSMGGFAAIVQTSFRLTTDARPLHQAYLPRLWSVPLDSPRLTDDGKLNDCRTGYELMPYDRQREELLEAHRCRGPAQEIKTSSGGTCETWACEVPFVSCRTDGGIFWPGFVDERATCAEPPAQFDFGGESLKFFVRVSQP